MRQLKFCIQFTLAGLLWMIFFAPSSKAQLKNWTLPGHYVDVSTIFVPSLLPTLPGFGHYNGNSTPLSHNLVHDENGNLLFFVVGTEIYDHTGHFAGSITNPYYDVVPTTGNTTPIPGGNNSTEIAIIPVPCNNDRYFVVFAHGEASPNRARIRYGMVDLTQDINDGLLVMPTQSGAPGVKGAFDQMSTHRPQINFAVSSGINNEHHLYIQVGANISVYKTGEDGNGVPNITPVSSGFITTLSNPGTDNSAGSISGTELELSHDNTKLVAVSSLRNGSSNNGTTHYEVFDLDPITGSFLGTSNVYSFTNVGLGKGMAFSPNGQYLWVTLAADPNFLGGATTAPTIGINYFPLTIGSSPTLTPMISNEDFSLSQLEIGAGGILFALGDNASSSNPQLAIVNDPDNPTTTSSGYSPANGMSFPLSNQLGTGLYYHGMRLIPDQIETHKYGASSPISILGESYSFECGQDASVCPTIIGGVAPFSYSVSYQGTLLSSGSNVATVCFLAGEECGFYDITVSDANGCSAEGKIQINRAAIAGVLSGPQHISPPDPFYLSLSGYTGEYVEYQLLTNCNPSPNGWVTIATGKLPQNDVVFNTTNNWESCFLTDELTYCFRAKVYCKEPQEGMDASCLPVITEELCIPVCVEGVCEPGGGGGDDRTEKLGLSASGLNIDLRIFPNPVQNKLNIHLSKVPSTEKVVIRVMDIHGKILNELGTEASMNGNLTHKLDLSDLASGMYLINVSGAKFNTTQKFLKQ